MRKNYWAKFEQENCYHVYNRCIDGLQLFKTPDNYHFFLQRWEQYLGNYCSLYAYCLIPNHFHFLIKCKTPNEKMMDFVKKEASNKAQQFLNEEITFNTFLESQFKRFFNSYVATFNKEHERRGSLLKAKFKRILIRNPANFARLLCYIHHNPIHHKLKSDYISWPYTSYLKYLEVIPDSIMETYHKLFGGKRNCVVHCVVHRVGHLQGVRHGGRHGFNCNTSHFSILY